MSVTFRVHDPLEHKTQDTADYGHAVLLREGVTAQQAPADRLTARVLGLEPYIEELAA